MISITEYEERVLKEKAKELSKHLKTTQDFSAPSDIIGSYAVVSISFTNFRIERVDTFSRAEVLFNIAKMDNYYISLYGLPHNVTIEIFSNRESAEKYQKNKIELFDAIKGLISKNFSISLSSYFENFSEIRTPSQLTGKELQNHLQDSNYTKIKRRRI